MDNQTPPQSIPPTSSDTSLTTQKLNNPSNHLIFILCLILGILQLIIVISLSIFVLPQLNNLYSALDATNTNTFVSYISLFIVTIFALTNILLGFKARKSSKFIVPALIVLVLSFATTGILVGTTIVTVINPIYKLTSEIKNGELNISISQTPDPTANWQTYTNSVLSLKYPSDYKIETNPQYINIYDKEENLGPSNLYLSIDYSLAGSFSNYEETVKEWSVRENAKKLDLPNGFKLIYSDENGQIYQVDTFLKYGTGAIRAFYRSTPEIPSKIYDQIITTIKLTDNQTIDTSNWKTYTNKGGQYSLKYPTDLIVKEYTLVTDSIKPDFVLTTDHPENMLSESVGVNVWNNPNNYSTVNWVKKEVWDGVTQDIFETLTIDGVSALRSSRIPGMVEEDQVFIQKNGKIYQIVLIKGAGDHGKIIGLNKFNQILSTFKFTP